MIGAKNQTLVFRTLGADWSEQLGQAGTAGQVLQSAAAGQPWHTVTFTKPGGGPPVVCCDVMCSRGLDMRYLDTVSSVSTR